jgi:hypothetical protein
MAFIGNTNTTQAFTPAVDYFSGNGSTTAFTLSRPVASVAQVQVTIDNVAQNPSSAYTVSSNTITFTSAPLSGTNNIYVYYTSPITDVIAPGQGTVTTTSMASSTGTGAGVFQTSPTINTPTLATPSLTGTSTFAGGVANAYGFGVGTAVPSSGAGISFPATQSASSNANTLDDYEEGTWLPTIGSQTQTFTMTEQQGIYVKVGQMVTVVGIMAWSSKGSAASGDALVMKNLPFASNSDGNNTRMVGVFGISPATSTSWYGLWLYGGGGQTYINITGKNSLTTASADLAVSDIQSSSISRFSITYITN